MRFFTLTLLAVVTVATVSATTDVAPFDGSGPMMEQDQSGHERLLGIHYISLADGVNPEDFERFVVEEVNPLLSDRFPGIHSMVMKGERNASGNEYLSVFDIQTVSVRDWYFPIRAADGTSPAYTAIWEACGEACASVLEKFNSMIEETGYTDFIEIARD